MMALQSGLIRLGRSFVGKSLPTIQYITRDAPNSSLWEECDDCPPSLLVNLVHGANFGDDVIEYVGFEDGLDVYYLYSFVTGNYATSSIINSTGQPFYLYSMELLEGYVAPTGDFVFWNGAYWRPENIPCDMGSPYLGVYFVAPTKWRLRVSNVPCPDPGWIINEGTAIENSSTRLVIEAVLGVGGAYRARADVIDSKSFNVTSTFLTGSPDFKQYVDDTGTHTAPIPNGANITRFYYGHFTSPTPFILTINGTTNP